MNLAFLNPCRQPDRIDSTLSIPQGLHPPRPSLSSTTASEHQQQQQQRLRRRRQRRRLSTASSPTSSSSNSSATTGGRRENDSTANDTTDDSDSERGKEISIHDDEIDMDHEDDEYASDSNNDKINKNNTTTTKQELEEQENEEYEEEEGEGCYWTACYAVSFHRRGNFLASGHASGLVVVHDFLGRNLSALYWPPPPISLRGNETQTMNGCAILKSFYFGNHGNCGNNAAAAADTANTTATATDSDQQQELGRKTKKDNNNNNNNNNINHSHKIGKKTTKKRKKQKKRREKSSASGEEGSTPNDDKSSAPATTSNSDNCDDNIDLLENYHERQQQLVYKNGVTSISWDRHGKTLLAGAIGDINLRLMDNTHPLVATECTDAVRRQFFASNTGSGVGKKNPMVDDDDPDETPSTFEKKKASVIAECTPLMATLSGNSKNEEEGKRASIAIRMDTVSLGRARLLRSNILGNVETGISGIRSSGESWSSEYSVTPMTATTPTASEENFMSVPTRRHPTLVLQLPQPLGGPVQLHPRESHVGLACLMDGSLALFYLPPMAYYEALPSLLLLPNKDNSEDDGPTNMMVNDQYDDNKRNQWAIDALSEIERKRVGNLVFLVPPPPTPDDSQYFITCAAFGKDGDTIWAVTKCGTLLAFRIDPSMMGQLRGNDRDSDSAPIVQPTLCVNIPGGTAAYQIIVSRNGKLILVNSADCSLRLYNVEELCDKFDRGGLRNSRANGSGSERDEKLTNITEVSPRFVFQDNISKAPWASCDFSGDGELVVGGCNSYPQPGDNYKLFLWNCITGVLVDQLTGPISSLYSVSCHPTRPFIAVGTSDDLIDVWGSRIDWVAFAPDFQALQQNELYEEREDEFDIVDDEDDVEESAHGKSNSANNQIPTEVENVDVMTIEKIPAYSDSEDETSMFYFDTKVVKTMSDK